MRHYSYHNFTYSIHRLAAFAWMAGECHQPDDVVHKDVVGEMEFLVEQLIKETDQLQFKAANIRASKQLREALVMFGQPTWGKMGDEFRIFWEVLEPNLRERRFVSIDVRRDDLLSDLLGEPHGLKTYGEHEKPSPVWPRIFERFPSIKEECEEAVYCYALERNTASVFHSMRVAEIGLRSLARRMKVTLPKGKPLEWGQWLEVLEQMEAKTKAILKTSKAGPVKDELLAFYNGSIAQFYGFKDEFRNQVMHKRKSYDGGHAESALTRVRDFMDKLASKIDERGRVIREQK